MCLGWGASTRSQRSLISPFAKSIFFLRRLPLSGIGQGGNYPCGGMHSHSRTWKLRKVFNGAGDRLQRPIEVLALVGRHQAGPQQSTAGWHRGMDRDIGVDAGIEERLPEQHRLPVVADDDRHYRSGRHGAVWEGARLDHLQTKPSQSLAQILRIVEQPPE